MAIIKVWCLPDGLKEGDLKSLFRQILSAVKTVPEVGVEGEKDITIIFPKDRMKWGLGEDIVAEISDLPLELGSETATSQAVRERLAIRVGGKLKLRFPLACVKCRVEIPDPRTGAWTSFRSNVPL